MLERGLDRGDPRAPRYFLRDGVLMSVAVFVDAGYLYSGGLRALTGSRQPRRAGQLNLPEAVAKLRLTASKQADNIRLLRIYWYDGMLGGRPSPAQEFLAYMDDVKLRLGVVRDGRQKGVDSLIVTDLIELARNHAISDAVLLAGDEDLRIGVQIAQSFGVRVHLIGIEPSRGNQSLLLMQEADTTTEWSKADIEAILSFNSTIAHWTADDSDVSQISPEVSAILDNVVDGFLAPLSQAERNSIAVLSIRDLLAPGHDSRLIGAGRSKIGRDLAEPERRYLRNRVKEQAGVSEPDSPAE